MKNNTLSVTAFVIVILAVVATLTMIVFSQGIRKVEWMDLESTAWACFGLAILGSVLGWCAFKRPLGKISAILGTLVVAGFFFQLLRDDGNSELGEPTNVKAIRSDD
jgi:hypothetical protein